jgi:hypothetical protein
VSSDVSWMNHDNRLTAAQKAISKGGGNLIPVEPLSLEKLLLLIRCWLSCLLVAMGYNMYCTTSHVCCDTCYVFGSRCHRFRCHADSLASPELFDSLQFLSDSVLCGGIDKAKNHMFFICKFFAAQVVHNHVSSSSAYERAVPEFAEALIAARSIIPGLPVFPRAKMCSVCFL